ncbi:hypothetical protein Poli38472_006971 [Pythium oligandrum]|uniref:BED-type domain-containing protein n=1 Tax=Pythium oligandrum TaxID=41045 RepID=A0A8K1C9F4_PYTOL|nr:hypothetical protein Poli38472_006971 [Pythium oligandrum]|eukprot:TMW58826.1 hypothetical protein Poli38472_006971 [Pythium oligandrum]
MDPTTLMAVPVPLEPSLHGKGKDATSEDTAVPLPASSQDQDDHDDDDQDQDHEHEHDEEEDDERAHHAASTTSASANAAAAARRRARGVGRMRVNDKGEPTMMLPSFIWDFFVKEANGKYVVCTLCPPNTTRFAYSGGTSTMNRHLRKKHQKYAPGKTAADYEYPKSAKRHAVGTTTTSVGVHPSAASHLLLATSSPASLTHHNVLLATGDPTAVALGAMMSGSLSPSDATRRHLIDLRNARRRATNAKRRKLLHGMMDTEQYTQAAASTPTTNAAAVTPSAADFDPSGFVTLTHATTPGASASTTTSGLSFPQGFELSDSAIDLAPHTTAASAASAVDVRLFDYAPSLTGTLGTLGYHAHARPRRNTPAHQKMLTHRLLKYLIAQYEPLDVSRMGSELGALVNGLEYPSPSLKLPSEDMLKLALANLYYSQREILKEVIADVEVLSLSLNNWKSVFGQNVLTVSGHWISQGFSRRDCVLEVYVLPLDETVNTVALLRDVMDKWEIPTSKVAALTMLTNGKEETVLHDEYPSLAVVNCFVHVLDNAVSAGLMKCAPLIRRCRNYVSYFIQNPSEYQIFLSLQRRVAEANLGAAMAGTDAAGEDHDEDEDDVDEQDPDKTTGSGRSPKLTGAVGGGGSGATVSPLPMPTLSVICDFEDRWNSTSEMICRIVELEQMLLLYKSNLESDTNPNRRPMQLRFVCCELSSEEWTNLKELARLLEPIEGVVHITSCEYPGLSIIYPLLHSIRKHLDDAELWVATSLGAAVRNAIANGLGNLELCTVGDTASTSPYLACLLDPRFKSLPFLDPSERTRLIAMLQRLHLELLGEKDDDQLTHDKKTDKSGPAGSSVVAASHKSKNAILHEFFPLEEPTNELDKLKTQVQQYLDSPSLPATDESENDPLEWWSRYQRTFPYLAKLAKKYLCMSAVSVPFFEAFTNYGQLMREKKARLDIEVAAQILFCRSVSRIPEMERMNV